MTRLTCGMAVAPAGIVNSRPEIVLPPGFALRIDYDPDSSPASLMITAYHDDAPVGQAHVNPREVGQRLRLEVAADDARASERTLRLRLTPQRAMRAIEMSAVTKSAPPREQPPPPEELPASRAAAAIHEAPAHHAMSAVHELAREGALVQSHAYTTRGPRVTNALVWLGNGMALVLPAEAPARPLSTLAARVSRQLREELTIEERSWSRMHRALRALSGAAADLLANPLRLYDAEADRWSSWRVSWRGVQQASGASEG